MSKYDENKQLRCSFCGKDVYKRQEIHHNKKIDSPSGTAKTLCNILDIPYEKATSHRLGSMFGQHKIYFALEDEVLEITHTAYSKKIFAMGAIEAGKKMAGI